MTPATAIDRGEAGHGLVAEGALEAVHRRFARSVLALYAITAVVALGALGLTLITDLSHQQGDLRSHLLRNTSQRADYLAARLSSLAAELARLGARAEVETAVDNEAARHLLQLSHAQSAFFTGVAVVDVGGVVVASEPQSFLEGRSFGGADWFTDVRARQVLRIVPVEPERDDSIVYLVSPVQRAGRFAGVLVGAVDLASNRTIDVSTATHLTTVLATATGDVLYPGRPPAFAREPAWTVLAGRPDRPRVDDVTLGGRTWVAAVDTVPDTHLELLVLADRDRLFEPARLRLERRLAMGLGIAVAPALLLILLLRRTLRTFEQAQVAAARGERLRTLGEASSLIAHEIKNSLNGVGVGVELMIQNVPAEVRARPSVAALRDELARLTTFTTRLLSFSRGVVPRTHRVDLPSFVRTVAELHEEPARDAGIALAVDIAPDADGLTLAADSTLIHSVVGNLIGNAIDAHAHTRDREKRIDITVRRAQGKDVAEIAVADNGPGLAPALRGRLFEPFTTSKPSGVGIGLVMSRNIARAHGGDLVHAPSAEGARFVLTLPLDRTS